MKRLSFYTLILASLIGTTPVWANGFHYDVSVSSELELDADNKVMGIRQVWDYDSEVTKVMLEDVEEISDAVLDDIGGDMMADLLKLGYFLEVRVDGEIIQHNEVEDYDTLLPSEDNLQLTMFHPFENPVDIKGKKMVIDMADPDGTGILQHADIGDISLPDPLKACKVSLEQKQDPKNEDAYQHGEPVQLVTIDCTQL